MKEQSFLAPLHRFLDARPHPSFTWHYEVAIRMALEAVLLVVAALPSVTSWRTAFAHGLVSALRLAEAWGTHAGRSIRGRAEEEGRIIEYVENRPEKKAALAELAWWDQWTYWAWPILVPMVLAAEARSLVFAVTLGVCVTYPRKLFDKGIIPAWRKSRLEWKARDH